jgi:hypothetical protein
MSSPELLEAYLKYDHIAAPLDTKTAPLRSSLAFFEDIKEYMDSLDRDILLHQLSLLDEVILTEKDIEELFLGGLKKPLLTRAEMLNEYLSDKVKRKKPELDCCLEKNATRPYRKLRRYQRPLSEHK